MVGTLRLLKTRVCQDMLLQTNTIARRNTDIYLQKYTAESLICGNPVRGRWSAVSSRSVHITSVEATWNHLSKCAKVHPYCDRRNGSEFIFFLKVKILNWWNGVFLQWMCTMVHPTQNVQMNKRMKCQKYNFCYTLTVQCPWHSYCGNRTVQHLR